MKGLCSTLTNWKMALTLQDLLKEERSEGTKQRLIWNVLAALQRSAARKANCNTDEEPPDFTENGGLQLNSEHFTLWLFLFFLFFFLHVNLYHDYDSTCYMLINHIKINQISDSITSISLFLVVEKQIKVGFTNMSLNSALELLQPQHKSMCML